jgi:hypothetical protein
MSIINNYHFNNMGRIGADTTDNTQRTVSNTKFANYMLSNYVNNTLSGSHVNFATQQPTLMFSGIAGGNGLSSNLVDMDSQLTIKTEEERALEKLQLFQRPFVTVPYLGRGYGDPSIESQLQQGEIVSDKKSVSTIMEKSFSQYSLYPTDDNMVKRVQNTSYTVEESALDGWVRGGVASREMATNANFQKNNRPVDGGY